VANELRLLKGDPGPFTGPDNPHMEMLERERLKNLFGVTLKQNNGQVEISVSTATTSKILFDVPSETFFKDAAQIEKRLISIELAEQQNLSKAYNVHFGIDGQDLGRPIDPSTLRKSKDAQNPDVWSRTPRLDELVSARFAFQKSFPVGRRGKQIDIEYLITPAVVDDPSTASFTFENKGSFILDDNGRSIRPDAQPVIFINPYNHEVVEKHSTMRETLEFVLIHELAHGTQYRLGVTQLSNEPNGGQVMRTNPSTHYASELGFRERPDGREYLQGHDGRFYMPNKGPFDWERVNASGEPINAKGEVTNDTNAISVSDAAVRSDALVKPPTDYFPNSDEEIAEGLAMFRYDRSSRGQLRNNNPVLYGIAESLDNADLAAASGTKGEAARWIRTPDGNIVPNTPEKLEQIILFDKRSR
jgi:hypothetical protein